MKKIAYVWGDQRVFCYEKWHDEQYFGCSGMSGISSEHHSDIAFSALQNLRENGYVLVFSRPPAGPNSAIRL